MKKYSVLLIIVCAICAAISSHAASFTSVALNIQSEGYMSINLPASGFNVVDLSSSPLTSVILDGYSAQTTGDVLSVNLYGALYQAGTSPQEWHQIPSFSTGSDTWSISGVNVNFVDEMQPGKVYIIEAYFEGVTTDGSKFYYNNGGENYKIMVLAGEKSDYTIKFMDGETAGITLAVDGVSREYVFSSKGERFPTDQIGQLSKLSIEGLWVKMLRASGVHINDVSVQYKVYPDGFDGQWNGIQLPEQQDIDGDKLKKLFYANNVGYALDLSWCEPDVTYVLELAYQVIDGDGKYYFFGRDMEMMRFKFSIASEVDPMLKKLDVNDDGSVNVADVNLILNYILEHP